jgi:hypothetical protein
MQGIEVVKTVFEKISPISEKFKERDITNKTKNAIVSLTN